jgi:hypothetical protein
MALFGLLVRAERLLTLFEEGLYWEDRVAELKTKFMEWM